MKIPSSIIYTVGDVLGTWYYSHTKLDLLFRGCGFPGDPPAGNCIQKCQEWIRRGNNDPDAVQLVLLGDVLVEFMNLDDLDNTEWEDGFRRITEVLAKNGLAFNLNGIVQNQEDHTSAPVPSTPIFNQHGQTVGQQINIAGHANLTVDSPIPMPIVGPGSGTVRPQDSLAYDPSAASLIWRAKLEFLLTEEAKAFDPAQKFKLQHDIAEARAKVRELGGQP